MTTSEVESAETLEIWQEIDCDLPQDVKAELTRMAVESPDAEVCGFITEGHHIIPIENVSDSPAYGFEMDQAHMMQVIFGEKIIATYHSHPGGRPWPSVTDSENMGFLYAQGCPWRYLIIVGAGVYEFRHKDRSL